MQAREKVIAAFLGMLMCLPTVAAEQSLLAKLDMVNVVEEYKPGCNSKDPNGCHKMYPSRAQLASAHWLSCTGYVMAKAYSLADQGIARDRMHIATFTRPDTTKDGHAVLIIDGTHVLDNMTPGVRTLKEYARFDPAIYPVPWK